MLTELLTVFALAFIPATFSFFLDYCLGKPMSNEPSTKAVFTSYSYMMAVNRLKKLRLYEGLLMQYKLQDEELAYETMQEMKLTALLMAQKYYIWEQAVGMCPFCTNFWVSLISAGAMFKLVPLVFIQPFFLFLLIPIFSHAILRKL